MPNKIKSFLAFFRLGDAILVLTVSISIALVYFITNSDIRSYLMNVSASFLFAAIIRGVELYRGIFRQLYFIRFFGSRIANNKFSIVYPEFGLNGRVRALAKEHGISSQVLFTKNNQKFITDDSFRVDLESCAASNDLRAMIELSSLFANLNSHPTRITPDKDWEGVLEQSFVSVGFSSNYVTHKWLALVRSYISIVPNPDDVRYGEFLRVKMQRDGSACSSDFHSTQADGEIGLVVKFRPDPSDRPDIIWFFCAGLGGDATIGSAVFLARKWPKLLKIFGGDDFILLIRTAPGIAMHASPIFALQGGAEVSIEALK